MGDFEQEDGAADDDRMKGKLKRTVQEAIKERVKARTRAFLLGFERWESSSKETVLWLYRQDWRATTCLAHLIPKEHGGKGRKL